jgi:thymidine kinase
MTNSALQITDDKKEKKMGFSQLTIGPMNSGKTAYLIVQYNNLKLNNLKTLIIKPALDTRDYGVISSRILPNYKIKADYTLSHDEDIPVQDILRKQYDVVLVDEIQMFTEHQIKQLHYLTVISDVHVYMYGLLMSCTGEPFPASELANSLCDEVIKLHTINKQKQRKEYALKSDANGNPVDIANTSQIEAGDSIYKSVSKQEYFEVYKEHMYAKLMPKEFSLCMKVHPETEERIKLSLLAKLFNSSRPYSNLGNLWTITEKEADEDNHFIKLSKATVIGRTNETLELLDVGGTALIHTDVRVKRQTEAEPLIDLLERLRAKHIQLTFGDLEVTKQIYYNVPFCVGRNAYTFELLLIDGDIPENELGAEFKPLTEFTDTLTQHVIKQLQTKN